MIRFKEYLEEKRRNPELNPKISIVELLKPYKNDPDMYISYTTINKIGINPKSQYDTPNGIYTYPLKEIWKDLIDNLIPFAGDAPYVWLVKAKNKGFIKDLYKDYTSKDYDKDMKKIKKLWGDKIDDIEGIIDEGLESRKMKSAVGAFWNITRILAAELRMNRIIISKNDGSAWNTILRKLGYSGFADKSSKGIIHPSEPMQAVFLSKDSFTVIDKFENKRYDRIKLNTSKDAKYETEILEGKNLIVWTSGTWISGTWEGILWKDGIWKDGIWEKGVWMDGTWKNGTWKKGTWKKGTWEEGAFKSGTWEKGTWKSGTFWGERWEKGTWEGGNFSGDVWEDGTWMGGIFHTGLWKRGTWKGGLWRGGIWQGGYDKDGNFHKAGDSPDKWQY